jgi:hypothetical protein
MQSLALKQCKQIIEASDCVDVTAVPDKGAVNQPSGSTSHFIAAFIEDSPGTAILYHTKELEFIRDSLVAKLQALMRSHDTMPSVLIRVLAAHVRAGYGRAGCGFLAGDLDGKCHEASMLLSNRLFALQQNIETLLRQPTDCGAVVTDKDLVSWSMCTNLFGAHALLTCACHFLHFLHLDPQGGNDHTHPGKK